jgi:hypothetical protein
VALILAASGASPAFAQKRAKELDRIHVLVVVDTAEENPVFREGGRSDRANWEKLLREGVPADRYTLKVLEGDNLQPNQIVDYFRDLKTGPNEGLVFFYTGHGATFRDRNDRFVQHTILLGCNNAKRTLGRRMPRETVINAMRQKNAGLIVILTDCCADAFKSKAPILITAPGPGEPAKEIWPTVRNLFFEHRGIVDITAEEKESALATSKGGLFTQTLMNLLERNPSYFKPAEKDFVTWATFAEHLKRDTSRMYKDVVYEPARAKGEPPEQENQVPKVFQVPGGVAAARPKWRFGVQTFDNGGNGVLVRRVFPDTPAARAGLEDGDVILSINGKALRGRADFADAVDNCDGTITVEVRKSTGEAVKREIKLEALP